VTRLAGSRSGRWASCIWGGFALGCGAAFAGSLSTAVIAPLGCLSAAILLMCAAGAPRLLAPVAMVSGAIVLGALRGA
jgi:hypothetical protein